MATGVEIDKLKCCKRPDLETVLIPVLLKF